jgi:CDP-paratose synthetase
MERRKVLLSGATGFLGSHLLRKIVNENFDVIIAKRSFSNTAKIDDLIPFIKSYNIDQIEVDQIFVENKIDIVIHTATSYGRNNEHISDIVNTNLLFPIKLLQSGLANGTKYFFNTDTFFSTNLNLPKGLAEYVISKKAFIQFANSMIGGTDLFFVNLPLEQMYGPGDDSKKFISYLIGVFKENKAYVDLTTGDQKRDLIYVLDVVDCYTCILNNLHQLESQYSNLPIGSGASIEIKDLVRLVKKFCNASTELRFGTLPQRKNEIMDSKADISKLLKFGWKPKYDLNEGLRITIENFKSGS